MINFMLSNAINKLAIIRIEIKNRSQFKEQILAESLRCYGN